MRKSQFLSCLFFFFCIGFSASVRAQAETIRIAAIFAHTGVSSTHNLHHIQAIRYAADELNQTGGLLGRPVEIVEIDNGSSPIRARLAAEKAVAEQVIAVIGASWSDHSMAMAPVLQKAGIPMISPDSTHARLTRTGDHIFRVCFTDALQGKILARFAALDLQAQKAVILQNTASEYSLGLSRFFSQAFLASGGQITAILDYKAQQEDFRPLLRKVMQAAPDLLFIPGHDESGRILRQAGEMGLDCTLMGGDGWDTWNFWGLDAPGIRKAYFTTHWSREIRTQESEVFLRKFQKFYHINESTALSYDAMMLLADAIRRAGVADSRKIRDALAATRDFTGVTGKIRMDENGDPQKPVLLMEITNGRAKLHALVSE